MMESVRKALIAPLVDRWLATSSQSWRTLPVPSGPPVAHTDGPDPDRVLLLGAGISMGYGMKSHDLALPGQLARPGRHSTCSARVRVPPHRRRLAPCPCRRQPRGAPGRRLGARAALRSC